MFSISILTKILAKNCAFTSSTSIFGESLATKALFHIFNFHIWRKVSRKTSLLTASTISVEGIQAWIFGPIAGKMGERNYM